MKPVPITCSCRGAAPPVDENSRIPGPQAGSFHSTCPCRGVAPPVDEISTARHRQRLFHSTFHGAGRHHRRDENRRSVGSGRAYFHTTPIISTSFPKIPLDSVCCWFQIKTEIPGYRPQFSQFSLEADSDEVALHPASSSALSRAAFLPDLPALPSSEEERGPLVRLLQPPRPSAPVGAAGQ